MINLPQKLEEAAKVKAAVDRGEMSSVEAARRCIKIYEMPADVADFVLEVASIVDDSCAEISRLGAERNALAAQVAQAREALRGHWHGVFLDGRNEHGSHVVMMPKRSIELEQDSAGDFLKGSAEAILCDAESKGFSIGHAVVARFALCTDEGFFSHYEFEEVSSELTALLYGTPDEQTSDAAAILAKVEAGK